MPMTEALHKPTITDMIELPLVTEVALSPDGTKVAWAARRPNWADDRFDTECFVRNLHGGQAAALEAGHDAGSLQWIGGRIALLATPEGSASRQVRLFDPAGGAGRTVTRHPKGVRQFRAFGGGLLFVADRPEGSGERRRMARYGRFAHVGREEDAAALYFADLPPAGEQARDDAVDLGRPPGRLLAIVDFVPCPAGDAAWVNCSSPGGPFADPRRTVRLLRIDRRGGGLRGLWSKPALPEQSAVVGVSPDGGRLLVNYTQAGGGFSNEPRDLWIADRAAAEQPGPTADITCLTRDFDHLVLGACWSRAGIFVRYAEGTAARIARLAEDGRAEVLDFGGRQPVAGLSFADDGSFAGVCAGRELAPEAAVVTWTDGQASVRPVTDHRAAAGGWDLGTVEALRWRSADGLEIDGVLRRPADFDPSRRYPLAVLVHGGPAMADLDVLLDWPERYYYPAAQLVDRGVLVLKVNYRGSAGRGRAFLDAARGCLGAGELADVEAGVACLVRRQVVDAARVACMGWSHGGFVSAYAATHSRAFAAVSVGAGVASWYLYGLTSDFPAFPSEGLSAWPAANRSAFDAASPIGGACEAAVPTLIQHGEADTICSVVHARQLRAHLAARNVPVELFVFPGKPHAAPSVSPRTARAVMTQNLRWLAHHLLGEPLRWD